MERERIEKEALEKERLAELEGEKSEALEKEKQKLEDEKNLWEKVFIYFEKFYAANDFNGLFGNLGWAINYSKNDGPIFSNYYNTKDHYLIDENKNFNKKGCKQYEECNSITITISTSEECKVSLKLQASGNETYITLNGTINFSNEVREMKIVEKMGWSKNPQDDKSKSYGIFFKNPIPFEQEYKWGHWSRPNKINSTKYLEEFHFPIFELDDLKSKTIVKGFQTLGQLCQEKLKKEVTEVEKEINEIVEKGMQKFKDEEINKLDTKEIITQAFMEWDINKNSAATIKLLKLACEDRRYPGACMELGDFIKNSLNYFPDSIPWYRKACELGNIDSCIITGSFTKSLKDPKGTKKMIDIKNSGLEYRKSGNKLEAERMFRIACYFGLNSDACWNLADTRGRLLNDLKGAKEAFIKGCELGDKDACKEKNKY